MNTSNHYIESCYLIVSDRIRIICTLYLSRNIFVTTLTRFLFILQFFSLFARSFHVDKWHVQEADFDKWKANRYFSRLHYPTHARYTPFIVGCLLACNVVIAHHPSHSSTTHVAMTSPILALIHSIYSSSAFAWTVTLLGLYTIAWPSLPGITPPNVFGQMMFTASFRTITSAAVALLLYRATVPPTHPWHVSSLRYFLSLPLWAPLSAIAVCVYIVHYRVQLELTFKAQLRDKIGIKLPLSSSDGNNHNVILWIMALGQFVLYSGLITFVLSYLLHVAVETPFNTLTYAFFLKRSLGGGEEGVAAEYFSKEL